VGLPVAIFGHCPAASDPAFSTQPHRGGHAGRSLREAWLLLTEREALALREALDDHLTDVDEDEEWHAHVSSDDGTVELTIGRRRDA
jgi:hypothetical protein